MPRIVSAFSGAALPPELGTKGEDFHRLAVLRGFPPKVIWIRLGNCATADVVRLLRAQTAQILTFLSDPEAAFLALG